ncbi:MAG: FadR/GntR family transcriptional regulator [Acidobacteriota bacterium]
MPSPKQSALHVERTARVIAWLCSRMQAGLLRPGDRAPSEAEMAAAARARMGHARAATVCLQILGVFRRRSDTALVVTENPPPLLLDLVAAVRTASANERSEALHILVTQLAGLAAHRATQDDHTAMAEEVAEMYAAGSPADHLEHEVRFHRMIARAAGNSVLAAFAEALMASDRFQRAADGSADLRESARMHGEIYRAIRRRQPAEARRAMDEHGRLPAPNLPLVPEEGRPMARRTGT